jgi:tetratricopeptide (TPR) repeat protein
MASIIPDYEYDIFISYRQKDNKGDRWVSEFVEALKTELESTFKEEINVYFDINPHDGLLETHDVDASLKDKLKCLVFIPIISRTYCDPKSFAWEHEFKAFVEQARKDQFGLKVKLHKGNVASRVLPVQIHEIAADDKAHIEKELGGILRPIEFIYKEPGVNRPLRGNEDHPDNNLNRTYYRNQINKAANAIEEIISGLKAGSVISAKESIHRREPLVEFNKEEKQTVKKKPGILKNRKLLSGVLITAILVIAAILAYPKIFKKDKLEKLRSSGERISVAVLPFQNMTNDTIWNVWQDGIQDMLITYLSNSPEELKVKQTETITGLLQSKGLVNYASITPSVASKVSQKLQADVVVYGNIKKAGSTIRLNAQLIDSKTEEVFKSFEIEGLALEDMIFRMTDSLKRMVKNFLIISKLKKDISAVSMLYSQITNSPEAFRYFTYGNKSFYNRDYPTASDWYLKALAVDSTYYVAALYLSLSYYNLGLYDEGKKWCLWIYKKRDSMPLIAKIMTNCLYAIYFEPPYEVIKYLKQSLEIDDQNPVQYYLLGDIYFRLDQFDKAIPEFEKSLEISDKWGSKPLWINNYYFLGLAYHRRGEYKKEKNLYKKAEKDFPDAIRLLYCQTSLALSEGKTKKANEFIEKYITARKENSATEADIASGLASIYIEANIFDKAEEHYRNALSLEPENPVRMNNLAWFLIDKDRNINEGMELIDKALELSPGNYNMLDIKGWGLYKLGKYNEALDILQESWDIRREKAVYYHRAYLHLEAAKKAVAGQK